MFPKSDIVLHSLPSLGLVVVLPYCQERGSVHWLLSKHVLLSFLFAAIPSLRNL